MKRKKFFLILRMLAFVSIITTSFVVLAKEIWSGDIYNPREEEEYSYRSTMERQDERNRQIQFQQYQQKQYMEQQRLINQQDMYNQTHQQPSRSYNSITWGEK